MAEKSTAGVPDVAASSQHAMQATDRPRRYSDRADRVLTVTDPIEARWMERFTQHHDLDAFQRELHRERADGGATSSEKSGDLPQQFAPGDSASLADTSVHFAQAVALLDPPPITQEERIRRYGDYFFGMGKSALRGMPWSAATTPSGPDSADAESGPRRLGFDHPAQQLLMTPDAPSGATTHLASSPQVGYGGTVTQVDVQGGTFVVDLGQHQGMQQFTGVTGAVLQQCKEVYDRAAHGGQLARVWVEPARVAGQIGHTFTFGLTPNPVAWRTAHAAQQQHARAQMPQHTPTMSHAHGRVGVGR